eukprot:scaffold4442_cov125-Amphora_coffeaeformis.AAC.6
MDRRNFLALLEQKMEAEHEAAMQRTNRAEANAELLLATMGTSNSVEDEGTGEEEGGAQDPVEEDFEAVSDAEEDGVEDWLQVVGEGSS